MALMVEVTLRGDCEIIGIDEVQFFPMGIVDALNQLANEGVYVIASGSNLNFKGDPFPAMGELLARTESIVHLTAVCIVCGRPAAGVLHRPVSVNPHFPFHRKA